jgi:hypothetical protein
VYEIVEESSDPTTLGRRQFTWALQEAVSKAADPSGWRMAPTRDGILAGNVSVKPSFTVGEWAEAGPAFSSAFCRNQGHPRGGSTGSWSGTASSRWRSWTQIGASLSSSQFEPSSIRRYLARTCPERDQLAFSAL